MRETDVIVPNEKSKEYAQVQMQMAMTDREWCDLILWSDNDWEVFRIERDLEYWDRLEKSLTRYFWDSYLPEIVDSRIARGLPPREPDYVIDALRKANKAVPFDAKLPESEAETEGDSEAEQD